MNKTKENIRKRDRGKIRRRWSIVVKRSPPEFLNHRDTWENRRFENNDDSVAVIEWFRRYPSNGPHYDPLRTIGEQSWNDRVVLLAKITRTSSWVISLIYGDKLRTRIQMASIRNYEFIVSRNAIFKAFLFRTFVTNVSYRITTAFSKIIENSDTLFEEIRIVIRNDFIASIRKGKHC